MNNLQLIAKLKNTISNNRWIYKLALANFILRILYIFIFSTPDNYIITDMGAYNERALNLIRGNARPFTNYWAPFFHIFLAVIYWPLEKLNMLEYKIRLVVVILAILGSISVIFIYKITRKLFNEKAAKFSAIVYAIWYPIIYLNIFLLSENLFIPLLYFGLYLFYNKQKLQHSDLLVGLVLGLATITRPAILIFIILFGLWLLIKKRLKYLIGFSAMFLLVLACISIFNQKTTLNTTKFISSGNGMNFAMEWCDAKSIEYYDGYIRFGFAPPANSYYPEDKRLFTSEPFHNESHYYKLGWNCIKENPSIIYRNIRSIKNTFDSEIFPNFVNIFAWRELYTVFKIFNIGLFFATIIALFKTEKRKIWNDLAPLIFLIIAIFGSVYIFNPGEERYLIPFTPIFIILNANWITSINKKSITKYMNKYRKKLKSLNFKQ